MVILPKTRPGLNGILTPDGVFCECEIGGHEALAKRLWSENPEWAQSKSSFSEGTINDVRKAGSVIFYNRPLTRLDMVVETGLRITEKQNAFLTGSAHRMSEPQLILLSLWNPNWAWNGHALATAYGNMLKYFDATYRPVLEGTNGNVHDINGIQMNLSHKIKSCFADKQTILDQQTDEEELKRSRSTISFYIKIAFIEWKSLMHLTLHELHTDNVISRIQEAHTLNEERKAKTGETSEYREKAIAYGLQYLKDQRGLIDEALNQYEGVLV